MATTFEHTVKDELGIHARPAGELVKQLTGVESDVTIEANGKSANAKSIMSIMALAVKQGDTITVSVSGSDEAETASKLESFAKENF